MKKNKLTLLSTAALAAGAFLLLAPNAVAEDTKTKLNSADARFIQKEAAAGHALVRIGELGVKNAERADVKAFAGKMVADHKEVNAELATLARSKGVELTEKADSKHANTYKKLEGESGTAFDKEFLSVVVSSHKKCVKNFEDAAEDAKDSEVKAWAAKMLPALQAHLATAEELRSAPTVTTGAASTGASTSNPATGATSRGASTANPQTGAASTGASTSNPETGATTRGDSTTNPTAGAASREASTTNPATGTASRGDSTAKPDNTARNVRDRNANTVTPLNQGNSKSDIETTAQIRKAVLDLDDISVNAKNVKIITNEGHVTLRGPVETAEEKRLIGEIANRIATSEHVDDQLEVKGGRASN